MKYGFNMKHNDLIQHLESNDRFELNLYKNKVFLTGNSSVVEKYYKEDIAKFEDRYELLARRNMFWYNVQHQNARVFFGLIKMINDAFVKLITSGGFEAQVKVKGKTYPEGTEFDEEQTKRLNDILNFNEFKDNKWGLAESFQSGLGYAPIKISIDESLSPHPIIEVIKPERAEVVKKRGITQEYKFKSRKEFDGKQYELQEVYRMEDKTPVIEYRLLMIEQDPIEMNIETLYNNNHEMFEALGLNDLIVEGELKTVYYDFEKLNDFPVILKNNTAYNSSYPLSPFGEPDTQGLDQIEDALSENLSSMIEEIRKGRIKVMISEDLVPKNKNGESTGFNDFRLDYEVIGSDAAKGESKIEIVQGKINSEKYLAGISSLIAYGCNKANIHPITVGITGVESIDASQESQVEREKVSMRTRETKLRDWRKALEKLFNMLLKTQDIIDNVEPQEYDITINFGQFANPSQENIVNLLSKAVEGSIISMREAQDRYFGEDMSDDEKEVAYIRTLIEKGVALTPAQRYFYEEKSKEIYGVTDEELINQAQQAPVTGVEE